MKDSEYILGKVIKTIKDNLECVETRLVNGTIKSLEDYKYNLGMRYILHIMDLTINDITKGDENYESDR
jgi:hypothetical protein